MADSMKDEKAPFTLLFEKDECKTLWRRTKENMLEFLLIKGDQTKICVIDVSNADTRRQLRALLELIKDNNDILRIEPISEIYEELFEDEEMPNFDPIYIEQDKLEEFHPIALPWHDTQSHRKSQALKMTSKRKYREFFGEDADYTCSKCFKHFKQKGNMLRHEKTHKKKTILECEECGAHYKHRQHFENHLKAHRGLKHTCGTCKKGFSSLTAFRDHKKFCEIEYMSVAKEENSKIDTANLPPFPKSLGKLKIPFDFPVIMK